MKKIKYLLVTSFITVSFLLTFSVFADDSFYSWIVDFSRTKGVEPTTNQDYNEECGACHFPYQPGLLPEQSWKKLFDPKQLLNHFEDNAELDEDIRLKLLNFTVNHSADKSRYKRSRKIISSLDAGQYPLRITEIPYIKYKHEDIPARLIQGNAQVNSLSYCDKCHQKADQGIYDDDTVFIPKKNK